MSDAFSFTRVTPFGTLVALPIDERFMAPLFDEEGALATTYAARRLRTFTVGRAVLRRALAAAGGPLVAVPRSARGAPVLPPGFQGSLSHKDELAVALVAATDDDITLGVDVELAGQSMRDIANHVLTPREQAALAPLADAARARAVLERFSIKEAFYKAIDPKLQRFVGFLEVEVELDADGGARFITPVLDALAPRGVEGQVMSDGDAIVTSVRIRWR